MTVRREQHFHTGLYFITFTCYRWLQLFSITNGYQAVYDWFDVLIKEGCYITGYVIMPNHIHALIAFRQHPQSINKRVGNGKHFIAYNLVDRLGQSGLQTLLQVLESGVKNTDKKRGKKHQVFFASFDCKECSTINFILQKLNYIHANPCRGTWNLADMPENYIHSSAGFYATGIPGIYKQITNFSKLDDIDLTNEIIHL
jgi:REP element-mobilizing transposase RayT